MRDSKPDEFTWSFASSDVLASAMKGHRSSAKPGTVVPTVPASCFKEIDYKPVVNEAVEVTKRYLKMCGDSFYFQ